MAKFKVGDIVVMDDRDTSHGVAVGSTGTVIHILSTGYNDIGVQWDKGTTFINARQQGHNCKNLGMEGMCWYVWEDDLNLYAFALENE